jgi:ketosteroid isomerase-like protein
MRRMILPLMLFVFAGCQPTTTELTEEQKAAIAEELTQAYDSYGAAVRQLSQDGVLGFFQQSEDLTFAEYGTVYRSWSALADLVHQSWPLYASVQNFQWGDLHIQVLAPTVAAVTTTFEFAASDTTGAPVTVSGTASYVWLHTDGGWKIVSGAETFPSPETPNEGT